MTVEDQDLIEHVADHLCDEQPEAVAALSDGEIRRRVALGIERARSHSLTQPEPITAFVTLMFLIAPNFDEHPAIAKALAARLPEAERLKSLFASTKESDWDEAAARSKGWEELS